MSWLERLGAHSGYRLGGGPAAAGSPAQAAGAGTSGAPQVMYGASPTIPYTGFRQGVPEAAGSPAQAAAAGTSAAPQVMYGASPPIPYTGYRQDVPAAAGMSGAHQAMYGASPPMPYTGYRQDVPAAAGMSGAPQAMYGATPPIVHSPQQLQTASPVPPAAVGPWNPPPNRYPAPGNFPWNYKPEQDNKEYNFKKPKYIEAQDDCVVCTRLCSKMLMWEPCRHLPYCSECVLKIARSRPSFKCPNCNAVVKNTFEIQRVKPVV